MEGVWKKEAAVTLEQCHRCTLTDLSILDCDGIGLELKDCTRCRVSECLIRDDRETKLSTLSLKLSGGKGNLLRGNTFANGAEIDPAAVTSNGAN